MSTPSQPARSAPAPADADDRPFAWFRSLGPRGRRAFGGAFVGYVVGGQ